ISRGCGAICDRPRSRDLPFGCRRREADSALQLIVLLNAIERLCKAQRQYLRMSQILFKRFTDTSSTSTMYFNNILRAMEEYFARFKPAPVRTQQPSRPPLRRHCGPGASRGSLIPRLVDQDPWAQLRRPMDMIRQG